MKVMLLEVEPFNDESVNNREAALFMRKLTGNETFEFDGVQRPKSMMITDLKYNLPRHSYANGYLLNVDIDTYEQTCERLSMKAAFENHIIGEIYIEFGEPVHGVNINAKKLSVKL